MFWVVFDLKVYFVVSVFNYISYFSIGIFLVFVIIKFGFRNNSLFRFNVFGLRISLVIDLVLVDVFVNLVIRCRVDDSDLLVIIIC